MNELIAILIILIGALFTIIIVFKLTVRATAIGKKGLDVGADKSKQVANYISTRINISQEEQFRKKLGEVVGEEIIRELTRQAIRNGTELSNHDVCTKCLGRGCSDCGNTGSLRTDD